MQSAWHDIGGVVLEPLPLLDCLQFSFVALDDSCMKAV